MDLSLEAFLGSLASTSLASLLTSASRLRLSVHGFACAASYTLTPCFSIQHGSPSLLRHSIAQTFYGYRNIYLLSIHYAFRPRLRSRLTQSGRTFLWNPWAFGVKGFSPYISLLTPAFSLPCSPPLLTVRLLPCMERSPTTHTLRIIHSFGNMLSPGTFSAQGHSTSELLRTL